jgi:hypothetical protein
MIKIGKFKVARIEFCHLNFSGHPHWALPVGFDIGIKFKKKIRVVFQIIQTFPSLT